MISLKISCIRQNALGYESFVYIKFYMLIKYVWNMLMKFEETRNRKRLIISRLLLMGVVNCLKLMESHSRNNSNLVSTSWHVAFLYRIDLKDKCVLREDANAYPFQCLTLLQFSLSYWFCPQWCITVVIFFLRVSDRQCKKDTYTLYASGANIDIIIHASDLSQLKTKRTFEEKTDFRALNAKKE